MHPSPLPIYSRRGSTLVVVIMFTGIMLLLGSVLLRWSLTERNLNNRAGLRLESRNEAEALAEFGFSQIRRKFETRSSFSLNPTGADALHMPPASFWTGSNADTTSLELIGGTINNVPIDGSLFYIDPNDENNQFDPLKGKYVFRRDVVVLAKTVVLPPGGRGTPITSYMMEKISVRGAPLFAHAIFYNMDLEIFPGANMTISGPVHANGNVFLYPGNGNTLTFSNQVTCTGNIYHAKKPGDDSSDGNSASARTGSITIPNKSQVATQLYNSGSPSYWMDSTKGTGDPGTAWSTFRANASQLWNGNLQTSAHGVQNYTPVAVGAYKQQTEGTTAATDDSQNAGRTIIEPSSYPATDDPNYTRLMDVEKQKYSNDAGLYIQVTPGTGTIAVSSRSKLDPTKNKQYTLPAGSNLVRYIPFADTTANTTAAKVISGSSGHRVATTTTTVATTVVTSSGTTTTTTSATSAVSTTNSATSSTNTSTSTSFTGMYDQHRQKAIDIIELDINGLRDVVTQMNTAFASRNATKALLGKVDPTNPAQAMNGDDWTGIVYVEVQGAPTTNPITGVTTPATNAASTLTGVRIVNGQLSSGVTLPSYINSNNTGGLTIATNAPVYIKGNFNADGTVSSGNPATDAETGELPAAIAGDAITILSGGFVDSTSKSSPDLAPTAPNANSIEISAAFLTGNTPADKNNAGNSSGGAHNLPRFLENWSGDKVYIRGSLVCLFESRIFTEPYNSAPVTYYGAPNRLWGFNNLFKAGKYPPGTPKVMSYRRIDFSDLNATDYQAQKALFNWGG